MCGVNALRCCVVCQIVLCDVCEPLCPDDMHTHRFTKAKEYKGMINELITACPSESPGFKTYRSEITNTTNDLVLQLEQMVKDVLNERYRLISEAKANDLINLDNYKSYLRTYPYPLVPIDRIKSYDIEKDKQHLAYNLALFQQNP
jgi:hypothetical protein